MKVGQSVWKRGFDARHRHPHQNHLCVFGIQGASEPLRPCVFSLAQNPGLGSLPPSPSDPPTSLLTQGCILFCPCAASSAVEGLHSVCSCDAVWLCNGGSVRTAARRRLQPGYCRRETVATAAATEEGSTYLPLHLSTPPPPPPPPVVLIRRTKGQTSFPLTGEKWAVGSRGLTDGIAVDVHHLQRAK